MPKIKTIILSTLALIGFLLLVSPTGLLHSVTPRVGEEALSLLKRFELPSFKSADETADELVERKVMENAGARCVEGIIRSGETMDLVLRRSGMASRQSQFFLTSIAKVFDPRKVRPGDKYRIWMGNGGEVLKFNYKRSPVEIYEASYDGKTWAARKIFVPIEKKQTAVAGVLENSLWESFSRAGADPDLIMGFVDLFNWDIDFTHESQVGDEFRVIYETLYADGEPIGNGRILAASYRDSDGIHTAVYWDTPDATGYFDKNGQSIRKSFLRSPLSFTRVTSSFSHARRNPVTHKVQPHLGVDFGAPVGTPVWAVADGTVVKMGREGASGNMIGLRHAQSYETFYLHLNNFAKGIRVGSRVDQGQVIGYVGSTGRSTGPHLDYRVRKNGSWVNPIKEKFTPGKPVPQLKLAEFRTHSDTWVKKLGELPLRLQVAAN